MYVFFLLFEIQFQVIIGLDVQKNGREIILSVALSQRPTETSLGSVRTVVYSKVGSKEQV